MTPRGHRLSIASRLARFVRHADLKGLQSYLEGQDFLGHFTAAPAPDRRAIVLACAKATSECEAKLRAKYPPPALPRKADGDVMWKAPGMVDMLRDAYQRGQGDEGAAQLLGITVAAAKIAKQRLLVAPATR